MSDIANEMTNSLSRDGQGGMLSPLQFADGTLVAPSISFTTEPTLGFYRPDPLWVGVTKNFNIATGFALQVDEINGGTFT